MRVWNLYVRSSEPDIEYLLIREVFGEVEAQWADKETVFGKEVAMDSCLLVLFWE